jgi:LmbE family N-acetylglucosaminyl deacetylase
MSASGHASDILSAYAALLRRSPAAPDIAASVLSADLAARDARKPCALIFSPHPDDECLTGALPLRLKHEQGWQIVNVSVTLGSDKTRRAARKTELAKACAVLGFDCILADEDGFDAVTKQTREENAPAWRKMVARLAQITAHYAPKAVFMPHAHDAHPAHIGLAQLGIDALASLPEEFICSVALTEYWHPLDQPNLMIGLSQTDAAQLLSALACHAGENARNPFDARFPAYLIDNVRRGSERVGGKGASVAPMDFAMLYRFGLWKNGKLLPSALGRIFVSDQDLSELMGG